VFKDWTKVLMSNRMSSGSCCWGAIDWNLSIKKWRAVYTSGLSPVGQPEAIACKKKIMSKVME